MKKAISRRNMLELIYKTEDSSKRCFIGAPVCIKEHDGKRWLMVLVRANRACAFDITRIVAMEEYFVTFRLACTNFGNIGCISA